MGTRRLVFTGGEPLLVGFLPNLLDYAKRLGQKTTLSTNAIPFLQQHERIMQNLDEIGIPIDGFDAATNALTRQPSGESQFNTAVEAINLILAEFPRIKLTIRTVVTAQNLSTILEIPSALEKMGINMSAGHIRWKLYQFNPIGEQFDSLLIDKLSIPTADFLAIWNSLRSSPYWFECHPIAVHEDTYAIVYPNGDLLTAAIDDERQNQYDFPLFQYKRFGNLCTAFVQTMIEWQKHHDKYESLKN